MITTAITVDVQNPNYSVVTYASQGDQLSRQLTITLIDGNTAWTPPSGAVAMVRYSKPDGTSGFYDTVEDGTAAVTVSGNVATVKLVQQMTTVAGTVYAQLNWYTSGTNPQRVSSFCWRVFVEASAVTDGTICSTDYYSILTAQIQQCIAAAEKAAAIQNMTVEASTLTPGSSATATVSGGTSATDPVHIAFGIPRGNTGETGPAPTVASNTVAYQQSTSGTVVPTGTWSDTPPAAIQGQYMWSRTTVSYGTSGNSVTYAVAYNGIDGSGSVNSVNGQTGTVVLDADDLQYDSSAASHTSGSIGAILKTHTTDLSAQASSISTLEDDVDTLQSDVTEIDTNKQDKLVNATATLTVAGWSNNTQTVNVSGVTASNSVIVTPAPASFSDYTSAVIYCSAQASGTLTFTCSTTPTAALNVNVMIVG